MSFWPRLARFELSMRLLFTTLSCPGCSLFPQTYSDTDSVSPTIRRLRTFRQIPLDTRATPMSASFLARPFWLISCRASFDVRSTPSFGLWLFFIWPFYSEVSWRRSNCAPSFFNTRFSVPPIPGVVMYSWNYSSLRRFFI